MIKHIGSTQEWANWKLTPEQKRIVRNDSVADTIYLDIYYVATSRGRNSQLTKKQLKKINNLIDALNKQMVYAMLAGVLA